MSGLVIVLVVGAAVLVLVVWAMVVIDGDNADKRR